MVVLELREFQMIIYSEPRCMLQRVIFLGISDLGGYRHVSSGPQRGVLELPRPLSNQNGYGLSRPPSPELQ